MIDKLVNKAAQSKSDDDYNTFFQAASGVEFFLNMKDENTIPLMLVDDGIYAISIYVSSKDKRLERPYFGIEWERVLEIVLSMQGADALVVHGSSDSRIAIKRNTIEELLKFYKNNININELITNAADSKANEDYELFFQNARGKEFFFNTIRKENETSLHTALIGEDLDVVVFYAEQSDTRLSENYAGIQWEEGLEMVVKMSSSLGLVIQSSDTGWIAIKNEKIVELLNLYKEDNS